MGLHGPFVPIVPCEGETRRSDSMTGPPEQCDDKDCPGCKMEFVIWHCHSNLEMDPSEVIAMFFDYLREAYSEEAIFQVDMQRTRVH